MPEKFNNKAVLADGTVIIDLTADTVTADKLASGFTAHDKSGAPVTGTCAFDIDSSGANAAVAEVIAGKTFAARGAMLTGTMPNNEAVSGTINDKDTPYSVPMGFHDGSGSVAIDPAEAAKLIPANIKKDVSILGVMGAHEGSELVTAQAKTAAPSFVAQTILPDNGYDYLTQVNVSAIAVTRTENAAGGYTVTIG